MHEIECNPAGGELTGIGTIVGTLVNESAVAPGQSPGTLTVDGDYNQTLNAKLVIEIGGLLAGDEFDLIDISGIANLDGTVEVSLFGSYKPNLGDSFVFLEASGGIIGAFDGFTCDNCAANGIAFDLVHGADFVRLDTTAVPLPASVWLLAPALGLIARRRRQRHTQ